MAEDIGGVWRTIGGRRVFIKDGDDLETAMKKSGKFDNERKKNAEKKKEKDNSLDKSISALNEINRLAKKAQHYTNDFDEEKLGKKGREMGLKEFSDYVDDLIHKSYENRNNYEKGDVIEYNTNYHGVNERWRTGEILQIEKSIQTHGYIGSENVYEVRDRATKNVYKIDAITVAKKITSRKEIDERERMITKYSLSRKKEY